MSNPAPSSHPSREPQPVNPYAASGVAAPRTVETTDGRTAERQFRIVMDWSDRYRFLKSVGLLRVYSIVGGCFGAWGLFLLLQSGFELVWQSGIRDWIDIVHLARLTIYIIQALIALSLCFVLWQLADALAGTAGGQTGRMRQWSRLHLRAARLLVAFMVVFFAATAFRWLESEYFLEWLADSVEAPTY